LSRKTGIVDINSDSLSELMPIKQELRSGNSSIFENTGVEQCKNRCSLNKSCSVASISKEKLCSHYMGSELGIWKTFQIVKGSQWFAKLKTNGTYTIHIN
jgi:hypothetical protein